jgi:hypothetical protein
MTTFAELYRSRCTSEGKPHFWNPQPLNRVDYSLFGDEDMPVEDSWGVDEAVQKVLALGLFLELPVGEWILSLSKKEASKFDQTLVNLLNSNVRDEAAHYKGICYCIEQYPVSERIRGEAESIANAWLTSGVDPIESACLAETGVFLSSLAILRLAGGSELATVAEQISRDESRHVATNRGVMHLLGLNPAKPSQGVRSLVRDTVAWLSEGLHIPSDDLGESFDFNQKLLLKASGDLVETGISKELNDLLNFGVYTPPFETSNIRNYSRVDY